MSSNNIFFKEHFELEQKQFYKRLLILLGLVFLYYFPFFLSDIPLIDDYDRKATGWSFDYQVGRPFATTVVSILSLKFKMGFNAFAEFIDLTPINQIISLLILSITAFIYCVKVFKIKEPSYAILISFFFVANPFYYESLSYTNDSIIIIFSTALALLTSILELRNRFLDLILGTLLISLFLSIYQATINLFFASVILIFLTEFNQNPKNAYQKINLNISKGVFGIIIYKVLILPQILYFRAYHFDHSKLINFDSNLFSKILSNFSLGYQHTISGFFEIWSVKIFSIIGLILFLVICVKNNDDKLKSFFITLIGILGIVTFIFGFLVMHEKMISAPRVYSSFSIFLVLIMYAYIKFFERKKLVLNIIMCLAFAFFFAFSYGYRGMLLEQASFNKIYFQLITSDLISLGFKETSTLIFSGGMDHSPSTGNSKKKNKSLDHFHAGNIGDHWHTIVFFKFREFKAQYQTTAIIDELFNEVCHAETLIKNNWYRILKNQDLYMVAFPNSSCY